MVTCSQQNRAGSFAHIQHKVLCGMRPLSNTNLIRKNKTQNGSVSPGQCTCNAGYERNKTLSFFHPNSTCLACSPGKFKAISGNNATCLPCPNGTYSNSTASSSCFACPFGASSESTKGITSIDECQCSPGYTPGTLVHSCIRCEAGKYKENAGSGACSSCAKGKNSDSIAAFNSSACRPCPALTISPSASTDVSQCICQRGTFGSVAGRQCAPCLEGFYKDTIGLSNCTACPPHSFSLKKQATEVRERDTLTQAHTHTHTCTHRHMHTRTRLCAHIYAPAKPFVIF